MYVESGEEALGEIVRAIAAQLGLGGPDRADVPARRPRPPLAPPDDRPQAGRRPRLGEDLPDEEIGASVSEEGKVLV